MSTPPSPSAPNRRCRLARTRRACAANRSCGDSTTRPGTCRATASRTNAGVRDGVNSSARATRSSATRST
nr:hypothetical protein [Enemella dayhoffiae]